MTQETGGKACSSPGLATGASARALRNESWPTLTTVSIVFFTCSFMKTEHITVGSRLRNVLFCLDFAGSNGRRESQGSLSSGASLELGTSGSGKNEVSSLNQPHQVDLPFSSSPET